MCSTKPVSISLSWASSATVVGIFEELLCEVGLGSRQGPVKIGERFTLPCVKPSLDLNDQDVPAPSVFDGRLDVPKSLCSIFYLVQNDTVVEPRQLSSNVLDD
jgi:hypothetical protein